MARAKHERLSREAAVDRAFRTRLRIGSVSVVSSDAGLLDWMDCARATGRGGVMRIPKSITVLLYVVVGCFSVAALCQIALIVMACLGIE